MRCKISYELQVSQTQRLTQSQQILIQGRIFALRMSLIQELRGELYEPKAVCPNCSRSLTPVEIIRGFNQDPNDFTTVCSACGYRFEPSLVCFGNGSYIELPFYCDAQTLAKLRGKETFSPERLAKEFPAIYKSAIVHHGGIKQAFEKAGIKYEFKEVRDWKNKIQPFLGNLPDTIIAGCVNMSVESIRLIRRKFGIARYTARKMLDENKYKNE